MDKQTITFKADNFQEFIRTSEFRTFAIDTINYIEAVFTLGDDWTEFPKVVAIWYTDHNQVSSIIDANGKTIIPAEILTVPGLLRMNLCASMVEDNVLKYRLTSYPVNVLKLTRTKI